MGCGSSSLKGDAANDITAEQPPARKVRTNFSDVDFSSGAGADRRGTMAVAPDEQRHPNKISEEGVREQPKTPTKANALEEKAPDSYTGGATLEPYKSLDGAGGEINDTNTLNKKMEKKSDLQVEGKPGLEEAAALSAIGTNNASSLRA